METLTFMVAEGALAAATLVAVGSAAALGLFQAPSFFLRGRRQRPLYCPPLEAGLPTAPEIWFAPSPRPDDSEIERRAFGRVAVFSELGLVVKLSRSLSEAHCLLYLGRHSDVPVPRLFGWRTIRDKYAIHMEHLPGPTLREYWPSLSNDQRIAFVDALRSIFQKVGSVPLPIGSWQIGSITGNPCTDRAFDATRAGARPSETVASFHDDWVGGIPRRAVIPDHAVRWLHELRSSLPDDCPVVFQHADIHNSNIVVSPTGVRILGIIDWEQAGYYPSYWDWCKAMWPLRPGVDDDWRAVLPDIIPPHHDRVDVFEEIEYARGTL